MANVTVFFSNKIKAVLNDAERAELVRQIDEKIVKDLKVKTFSTVAASIVSGPDVSVNLDDIGNITGMKSDFLAWQIKNIIIGFVLLRRVLLTPDEVRIETSLRTVN